MYNVALSGQVSTKVNICKRVDIDVSLVGRQWHDMPDGMPLIDYPYCL